MISHYFTFITQIQRIIANLQSTAGNLEGQAAIPNLTTLFFCDLA